MPSRDGRPSKLHPGGYGAIPIKLQLDELTTPTDLLVYGAISSSVNYRSGSGPVRFSRIQDRSRRRPKAIRESIRRLADRRYIKFERQPGQPYVFTLLSTAPEEEESFPGTTNEGTDPRPEGATTSRHPLSHSSELLPNNKSENDLVPAWIRKGQTWLEYVAELKEGGAT